MVQEIAASSHPRQKQWKRRTAGFKELFDKVPLSEIYDDPVSLERPSMSALQSCALCDVHVFSKVRDKLIFQGEIYAIHFSGLAREPCKSSVLIDLQRRLVYFWRDSAN